MSAPTATDTGPLQPARRPALRRQLAIAYGVIVVAAIGLALGAYFLFLRGSSSGWSSWKPSARAVPQAAQQIAAHVAPRYKLADGSQMARAAIFGDAAKLQSIVFLAKPKAKGTVLATPTTSNTVQYALCGFGSQCAVNDGSPTTLQSYVLQQEGLELALYSFKYLPSVGTVVVYLPPKPQEALTRTFLVEIFKRGALAPQLRTPLSETVGNTPPLPGKLTSTQAEAIAMLTVPSLYLWGSVPLPNGQSILQVHRP